MGGGGETGSNMSTVLIEKKISTFCTMKDVDWSCLILSRKIINVRNFSVRIHDVRFSGRQKLCRTFYENAKGYEIVSRDTVAYACLGICVAWRYENVSQDSFY